MNKTIDYYETNAEAFAEGTRDVKMTDVQDRFLAHIIKGGRILDFGCGSGRDAKYFLSRGYAVDAADGSEKLCGIAEQNTGIKVKHMLFSELCAVSEYDGIWACASILHLPKAELLTVFQKMAEAVKPGGYIYASFKYGEYEGVRNGRYFTDFTKESFGAFLTDLPKIKIIEEWVGTDARPGREDEKWLNLILLRGEGPVTE